MRLVGDQSNLSGPIGQQDEPAALADPGLTLEANARGGALCSPHDFFDCTQLDDRPTTDCAYAAHADPARGGEPGGAQRNGPFTTRANGQVLRDVAG